MLAIIPLGDGSIGILRKLPLAVLLALMAGPVKTFDPIAGLPGEVFIGLLIGLPLALLITAAGMFGDLFDTERGQSLATIYDPLQDVQESATGILLKNLLWAELLFLGAGEDLVRGFILSFERIAPGSLNSEGWFFELDALLTFLTSRGILIFKIFIPWAVLFLAVEISMGFVSKVVPQVSLSSESFQLKSYLGVLILASAYAYDIQLDFAQLFLHERGILGLLPQN